jgi:hypothetical protein
MIPLARPALLLFVAVLASGSIHAKTWIADSDPNHTADFRSAQEAHDGAEEGDVIYFVGSFRHYGDLIATKRLTYVGPGYFLGENNPNFQNLFPARLKTVSLTYEISNAPSDNVDPEEIISDSSGSVFQGVTIETQLHIIANDAVFKGCNIYYLNINNSSPFIPAGGIEKRDNVSTCIFVQSYFSGSALIQMSCSEVYFGNSIFSAAQIGFGAANGFFISSVELENNIFDGSYVNVSDGVFRNNLFATMQSFRGSRTTAAGNVFNAAFWDNSAAGDTLDESTNTSLADDAFRALFDGAGTDGQYLPAAGNANLLNGIDGAMVGPFGGSYPYVLSGLPNIPRIIGVDAPRTGPSQGSIPVTLKIRLPQ